MRAAGIDGLQGWVRTRFPEGATGQWWMGMFMTAENAIRTERPRDDLLMLRHSSRSRPLNDSMWPVRQGWPGGMNANPTRSPAQSAIAWQPVRVRCRCPSYPAMRGPLEDTHRDLPAVHRHAAYPQRTDYAAPLLVVLGLGTVEDHQLGQRGQSGDNTDVAILDARIQSEAL